MSNNKFSQTVAADFAPQGSTCEWCNSSAVQQLTAIGGRYHNMSGLFCQVCGELFVALVNRPSDTLSEQEPTSLRPATGGKYGNVPPAQAYKGWVEGNDDDIPIPLD